MPEAIPSQMKGVVASQDARLKGVVSSQDARRGQLTVRIDMLRLTDQTHCSVRLSEGHNFVSHAKTEDTLAIGNMMVEHWP